MGWSRVSVLRAREATDALLKSLHLDAYLFAIEPHDNHHEVRIDYATYDGWKTVTLDVPQDTLFASREDPGVERVLTEAWRRHLRGAKYEVGWLSLQAEAAGQRWAEVKAEALRDNVPALDWPDMWADAENGRLPFNSTGLPEGTWRSLEAVASHAAHILEALRLGFESSRRGSPCPSG